MGAAVLILTWLAAEPVLIQRYDSIAACERALADAMKDPGASGVCIAIPIAPTTPVPDFLDRVRSLAMREDFRNRR